MHKKIFYLTTMLIVVFFIPKIVSANVVINEICWMGSGADHNNEWIELKNTSEESIDLTNWTLEAVDGSPSIILLGNIPANGYFLLERSDDDSVPSIAADQIYSGALSNTGEYLKLKNSSNNTIDEIGASDGWPAGNNSTKQTMEKTNDGWQTSLATGGTPKDQNSIGATEEIETETEEETEDTTESETSQSESESTTDDQTLTADAGENIIAFIGQEINFDGSKSSDPNENEIAYFWNMGNGELIEECQHFYSYQYPGTYLVTLTIYNGLTYSHDTITIKIEAQKITINEFIPDPESDDEENEWIEIYNDSDSIVDISNWQLDDDEGGSSPFVFPENTLIAPKNYLVFSRKITKIALNNDYDKVRLLLPEGMVFQEIEYQDPKQGQSSAFIEQGFIWSVPTPGMPNINNLAIGGNNEIEDFFYDYQTQTYQTQESNQDYSWYYNPPQEQSQGGFVDLSQQYYYNQEEQDNSEEKNELAAVFQEEIDAFSSNSDLSQEQNKSTENLIVLIFLVILGALIIGILITKIIKKNP